MPKPVSAQMQQPLQGTLLLCDFDNTLTDYDAGEQAPFLFCLICGAYSQMYVCCICIHLHDHLQVSLPNQCEPACSLRALFPSQAGALSHCNSSPMHSWRMQQKKARQAAVMLLAVSMDSFV